MSNLLVIPHLDLGKLGPLNHLRLQIQVVVNSIIMELLLRDLVSRVSQSVVHPVEDVQSADTASQYFHVHISSDDVESEQTLDLHNVLMKLLYIKTSQELYNKCMLFNIMNFSLIL